MAKKESGFSFSNFVAWATSVLVSLAVGSGMINKTLSIPFVPSIITIVAGWIVVVGTIVSIILAVFNR
ncbi:Uncharacterised protein [uncultured archaeon]|nr:Uncharacterised protein [uncultured archaeon]